MTTFPGIFRLRQTFDVAHIEDVPAEVHSRLARPDLGKKVHGQTVAITAGSRGIANVARHHPRHRRESREPSAPDHSLSQRWAATVAVPQTASGNSSNRSASPSNPPAAPSLQHRNRRSSAPLSCGAAVSAAPAGGTPAPNSLSGTVPIFARRKWACPLSPGQGSPLHFDRLAFEADHVLICNRVKPHTSSAGPIESGS